MIVALSLGAGWTLLSILVGVCIGYRLGAAEASEDRL